MLRKTEEKYRNIFEGAVEGIFETSPEGKLLTANPALAKMLGYESPGELISLTRDTAHLYADPEKRAELAGLLEKQGVVLGFECEFVRRKGAKIWVSINGRRVCGPDGKTVYYSGFLEDITERKRAEKTLRESEEKFRVVSENARAIFGIIQGKRFIYANPYLAELSGYTVEEILSMDFSDMIHPSFRDEVVERARKRLEEEPVPSHYEFMMRTKSGEPRWLDFSPDRIELNGKPAIIGTAFDISERKKSEKALAESQAQVLAIFDSTDDFIWSVEPQTFGLVTFNRGLRDYFFKA